MLRHRVAVDARVWQTQAMTQRNPRSGGFFLTVAILAGAIAGVALGSPIIGAIAGAAVGVVIVLAFWLADRRDAG